MRVHLDRSSLRVLLLFVLISIIPVSSLVVSAAEASAAAELAVDLATSMAAEKDIMKGIKEFTKEKYDEWMWQSIGGFENLVTGNLVGDGYLSQINDKVTGYLEIITAIQDFVLAVEAGKYDEAAFIAIDQAVGAIDHPLVILTWEMAKLTYESHKAVQETRAALLVERLFSALHKDRRLLDAPEGQMAQIPEDARTVDYFFEKYIVTDASTREMVRAYVETRLGEEWPEQTWSSWFKSIRLVGSGVDSAEAEEIEALAGELRNTARRWIASLIKDVNLEARRWYYEAKMRQQKAEFERFLERYREFRYELPQLMEMYAQARDIRARMEEYTQLIDENAKALEEVRNSLAKVGSPPNPATLSSLYSKAISWRNQNQSARAATLKIDEYSLAERFENSYIEWNQLAARINDMTPPPPESPSESLSYSRLTQGTTSDEYYNHYQSQVLEWFGEFIEPQPIPSDSEIEEFKTRFTEALNRRGPDNKTPFMTEHGQVNVYHLVSPAASIVYEWRKLAPRRLYRETTISYDSRRRQNLHVDAIDRRLTEVEIELEQSAAEREDRPPSQYDSQDARFAASLAREIYNTVVYPAAAAKFSEVTEWMEKQVAAVQILQEARATQYAAIVYPMSEAQAILDSLPKAENLSRELEENLQFIRESVYTYFTRMDGDTSNLAYTLRNEANRIMYDWYDSSYADDLTVLLDGMEVSLREAEKALARIEIPSSDEIEQIHLLVDENFDMDEVSKLKQQASNLLTVVQTGKAQAAEMKQILETDYHNRKNTADWLTKIAEEWEAFIEYQLASGKIERFSSRPGVVSENDVFVISLPEGFVVLGMNRRARGVPDRDTDGMIVGMDPYPHLLTAQELTELANSVSLQAEWSRSSGYQFMQNYMPEAAERFTEMTQFQRAGNWVDECTPAIRAAEPNFIHPIMVNEDSTAESFLYLNTDEYIIWMSDLERAMEIVESLSYKDSDYEQRLIEIRDMVPNTLRFVTATEQKEYQDKHKSGEMVDLTKLYLMTDEANQYPGIITKEDDFAKLEGYPPGEMYKALCEKLLEIIRQERLDWEEEQRQEGIRQGMFVSLANEVRQMIESVEYLISSKDYDQAIQFEGSLEFYREQFAALVGPDPDNVATSALEDLAELIAYAKDELRRAEKDAAKSLGQIQAFYDGFARAYESKNTSAVLRLIDDDWEAGDGSDLWDLEDTLDRNFRVFDEIEYRVSNIQVLSDLGDGRYLVTYELSITSLIYSRNMKHEENSVVEEEIQIGSGGAGKILVTRKGQFWR